jgi:anti-anti-sigma regulatory factor
MPTTEARPAGEHAVWRPSAVSSDPFRVAVALGRCGPDVVIDLTQYSPHDTFDIGTLVSGVRQFYEEGGHPVLLCPSRGMRTLLGSTGIDRLVPLVTDQEAAEAQLDAENR